MILLPCDQAFALDYLSILHVKSHRGMEMSHQIKLVTSLLEAQIPNLNAVMASREYLHLSIANDLTFDAIDKASKDQILASEVQRTNRKRFLAKRKLQQKFWPEHRMMEIKTKAES